MLISEQIEQYTICNILSQLCVKKILILTWFFCQWRQSIWNKFWKAN